MQNIIVAFGGVSPEHEVSVISGMQAMNALKDAGYNAIPLCITKAGRWLTGNNLTDIENYQDLKKLEKEAVACTFAHDANLSPVLLERNKGGLFSKPKEHAIFAVFTAFHGADGENGAFQGTCEMFNIPYTGSGVLGSAVGMDKAVTKKVCESNDIPVVPYAAFYEEEWVDLQQTFVDAIEDLGYPVFVKPARLGSSIGVYKVDNREELLDRVETAFRYDAKIIVEKGVQPLLEINCSVMGDPVKAEPSVCEQPMASKEVLSFEDKYLAEEGASKGMASADRIIPAPISDELTARIQNMAVRTFAALNCSGLARLDFLVNADTTEIYFNELNSIPGSFSFYLWDKNGITFPQLVKRLVDIALNNHRIKNGRIRSYETNLLSKRAGEGIKGLKGVKKG